MFPENCRNHRYQKVASKKGGSCQTEARYRAGPKRASCSCSGLTMARGTWRRRSSPTRAPGRWSRPSRARRRRPARPLPLPARATYASQRRASYTLSLSREGEGGQTTLGLRDYGHKPMGALGKLQGRTKKWKIGGTMSREETWIFYPNGLFGGAPTFSIWSRLYKWCKTHLEELHRSVYFIFIHKTAFKSLFWTPYLDFIHSKIFVSNSL